MVGTHAARAGETSGPELVSHGLLGPSSFPVTKEEATFVNSPLRETDVASPLLSYEIRVRKAKRPRDEVSADAKK